jgi:hypothetical protein
MKTKNVILGLIGIGAISGLYFWNKNKNKLNVSSIKSTSVFSNEDIEKYAKQFSDEFVVALDKQINYLTLEPIESFSNTSDSKRGEEYIKNKKLEQINSLKKIKNNYGDIYLTFKQSIPKFKNIDDLTYAKNLFIKTIDKKAFATNEEQIWMANNKNLGENFGFELKK